MRKLLIIILYLTSTVLTAQDRMPDFSWDKVPLYMHVRKATAFTDDEVRYLAQFPLITFEKTTGAKEFGSTEKGTLKAAESVKAINPRVKILYYRNIIVHYSSYDADSALKSISDPFLVGKNGNTSLVSERLPAYDLSNPAIQSWWIDNAKRVCSSKYIDGLFIDGNIKALEPSYLAGPVGTEKKNAVEASYHEIMKELPGVLGPDKLILANIIRARFKDSGLECLEYFDGSYIEGFEHDVGKMSRKDYVAKGIAAIQTAARKGKIIAFTMGMGRQKKSKSELGIDESREAVSDLSSIRNRFIYSLSLFLICAEKYSYFMASDGYGVDDGESKLWMKSFPEYSYPLGAPKGPTIKKGYRYERDFEHARVIVDIQSQTGEIIWK